MGRVVACALALLAGCGDDGMPPPTDGGGTVDGGADGGVTGPAAPAEPAPPMGAAMPPVLTPCPSGWREVAGEPARCDPWPASGRATCPDGEAHFPGEPGCRRVGSAPPAGEWPADLGASVLYVRAGAPAGGDGSIGSPFGRIADAAARATGGTVIAVSRGTFDEGPLVLRAGITLRGASAADTIVTYSGAVDPLRAVIGAGGADVVLQDLRVTGNLNGVEVIGAARTLRLQGVIIDGVDSAGAYVAEGGALVADDVVIRGVRASTGRIGRGVSVESASTATLTRVVIEQCREAAIFSGGPTGTVVRVEDSAILDTAERPMDDTRGYGAFAVEARLELERVVIERSREAGLAVTNTGAIVVATDLVVRDTLGRVLDTTGIGVIAQGGDARLELDRTLIEHTVNSGVFVDMAGATARLRDVVVDDTNAAPLMRDMSGARGLLVQRDAMMELERVLVARTAGPGIGVLQGTLRATDLTVVESEPSAIEPNRAHGLVVNMNGDAEVHRGLFARNRQVGAGGGIGRLLLEDVVVRDTPEGVGVQAQEGLSLELRRTVIEQIHGLGIGVAQPGTTLLAEDVVIRDISPLPDGRAGAGIGTAMEAAVTLRRVAVERCVEAGIGITSMSTATMEDVVVRDTAPRPSDGLGGHGLQVQEASTVTLARGLFERNHGAGIYAISAGTTATFDDLVVRETGGVRFMDVDGVLGEGLLVIAGATARVTRGLFERNHEASVVVFGDGTSIRLFDVDVLDTLERECAPACAGSGSGLVALEGGTLEATDFEVRRSALAGIQLARRGVIDLHQGLVAGNPIGANVQTEAFDVSRLQDAVIYRDNGRNLDSATLFVPAPPTITTASGM